VDGRDKPGHDDKKSSALPLDIEAALALEYRMTQRSMEAHDFFEGVRALLVDKDQNPRWRPARLDEVTQEQVDRYFATLGANELTFPD
jgi:enoyl-CoA hydratase